MKMSEMSLINLLNIIQNSNQISKLLEKEEKTLLNALKFLEKMQDEIRTVEYDPDLQKAVKIIFEFLNRKRLLFTSAGIIQERIATERSELLEILSIPDDKAISRLTKFTKPQLVAMAAKEGIKIPKSIRKDKQIQRILDQGREKLEQISTSISTHPTIVEESTVQDELERFDEHELDRILSLKEGEAAAQLSKRSIPQLYAMADKAGLAIARGLAKTDLIHKIISQGRMKQQLDIVSASTSPAIAFSQFVRKVFKRLTDQSHGKFVLLELPRGEKISNDFQLLWRDKFTHSIWVETKWNVDRNTVSWLVRNTNDFPLIIISDRSFPERSLERIDPEISKKVWLYHLNQNAPDYQETSKLNETLTKLCIQWFK